MRLPLLSAKREVTVMIHGDVQLVEFYQFKCIKINLKQCLVGKTTWQTFVKKM